MSPSTSTPPQRIAAAAQLMTAFAERTGLDPSGPPRRYLWTDAFAVGNFLGLARVTGEGRHVEQALRLVEAVHRVLGRHRPDDRRVGWISGRTEKDGEAHPTSGGLRIGKKLPERPAELLLDDELEWDRDGQYFHYLTKWMHALSQMARSTGTPLFAAWARELGKAAHDAFAWTPPDGRGRKRMYWKMSIDLSRPLVTSMGQHDALDGYVACLEADAAAARLAGASGPALGRAAVDFAAMIDPPTLSGADPLGIGGLLTDAYLLEQLRGEGLATEGASVDDLLAAALAGLDAYLRGGGLRGPAERRLGFRELGLAIGLEAVARLRHMAPGTSEGARRQALLRGLAGCERVIADIVSFWLEGEHQRGRGWSEHRDINEVMLATALVPDGYLSLQGLAVIPP
jgi:hypothetical protein